MRHLPALLLLLLPCSLFGQNGYWRNDTISLKEITSDGLGVAPDGIGKCRQLNDSTWRFSPDSSHTYKPFYETVTYYHSDANLFSDCVYFDLLNFGAFREEGKTSVRSNIGNDRSYYQYIPSSLRFITDTNHLFKTWQQYLAIDQLDAGDVNQYLQPFYFRKYEVTNKEYKEFVEWVKDSITMRQLAFNGFADDVLRPGWNDKSRNYDDNNNPAPLNWTYKIKWDATDPDYRTVLDYSGLIITDTGKFLKWVHFDVTKLNYKFATPPSEFGKPSINIYPDTLSWVHDFAYSFNEPMTNMYFWHPAYDNYPVVGLTYWQCQAFLEWKSKQLTQQLNAKGKKYKMVCMLPSNAQWDMASTAYTKDEQLHTMDMKYGEWTDLSWFTDLQLSQENSGIGTVILQDSLKRNYAMNVNDKPRIAGFYSENVYSPLNLMLTQDDRTFGDLISDGYFHTGPVAYSFGDNFRYDNKSVYKKRKDELKTNERFQMHFDKQSGIDYMDGNVSEWMRDDLDSTWRPVFFKHLQLDSCPQYDQFKTVYSIQKSYYDKLPAHGKLVRGCNWYDERYSNKNGKNTAGTNAKTFEDPSKDHCTLGFRYVVYVYPAE